MKHKTIISLLVIIWTGVLLSQSNASKRITILVDGAKSNLGTINVAIYQSDSEFNSQKFVYVDRISATQNAKFIFENVPSGKYAVAVYHDENKNMKMDRNLIGIPKEGYGFSNNAKGSFGPPEFKDTSFLVKDSDTYLNIRLNY